MPLDGNRAGLNANGQLTLGKVELDAGSQTLRFLALFNQQDNRTVPGFITPLVISIVNGRLTYQDFTIKVGEHQGGYKHQLVFFGDIDLASTPERAISIKARYPADGLAKSIKEVPTIVGVLYVEIDFFGPLYDAQGNSIPLEHKINVGADLPKKPEDILKDPNIQKGIGDLLKRFGGND